MDSEEEHVQTVARKEEYRTHLQGRDAAVKQQKRSSKPKSNPTIIRKPPSFYKSRKKSKSGDGDVVLPSRSNKMNGSGDNVTGGAGNTGEQAGMAPR
jgi:hypothetical protein